MDIMHQSILPAPSTPLPPGKCGAFSRLVSNGGGAFANVALPGSRAFANPRANLELLKRTRTHVCMHFFIAYQARIT